MSVFDRKTFDFDTKVIAELKVFYFQLLFA